MKRSQPFNNALWVVAIIIAVGIFPGCGAKPSVELQKPSAITAIEPRETDGRTEILVELVP